MKNNRLEIRYKIKEKVLRQFEYDVNIMLHKLDFKLIDSGYDFKDKVRDLSFEREIKGGNKCLVTSEGTWKNSST